MSPIIVVFAFGVIFACTACIFLKERAINKVYDWLIFDKIAPVVTLGIGGSWYLWNIMSMDVPDTDENKSKFCLFFGVLILLSFFKMRELLAIRGLSVLILLACHFALHAVYCEPVFLKNIFLIFVYLMVVFGMVIGAWPYVLRNFLEIAQTSKTARYTTGALLACHGIFFTISAAVTFHRYLQTQ